jgi:hypothetical protein
LTNASLVGSITLGVEDIQRASRIAPGSERDDHDRHGEPLHRAS